MSAHMLLMTVAVEFDDVAEALCGPPYATTAGESVARELLAVVSIAVSDPGSVLAGSYARLVTHSHLVAATPQHEGETST